LVVLLVLVAVGMGVTSVLFQFLSPQLRERMGRARAEAPKSGEPRVDHWLGFGRGFVHQRLVQLHYSADEPWLVTHTIGPDRDAGVVDIWGVDLAGLSADATSREGMNIVLSLPAPRVLARGPFGAQRARNDKARNVPHFASLESAPDPAERARSMVLWALDRLIKALERDIEGARFQVRFEPPGPAGAADGARPAPSRAGGG
jgi:hypothetical protein